MAHRRSTCAHCGAPIRDPKRRAYCGAYCAKKGRGRPARRGRAYRRGLLDSFLVTR